MARKKIREYNSKRIFKEHLKRLAGIEVDIKAAQVSPLAPSVHENHRSNVSMRLRMLGWILCSRKV
jgi:hypothetical protein